MSPAAPLMHGKRGLIMGVANDRSIAWGIARACHEQGAELAFSFQGEALEKRVRPLATSIGSKLVLPCDVTDAASIDAVFAELDKACFIARLSNDLARPGGERADEAAQAVRAHLRGFGVGAGF